jgi:hypothetical protein
VQRHRAGGPFQVEPSRLGLVNSGGKPLPEVVRGKMEAALGADFSNVRVHTGPQAERIGAIASTTGNDIYFAPGRFQPDSVQGQQLLGHELAHVVQQRAGRVRNLLGSGLAVVQDHALEVEADRMGQRVAAHRVTAQAKMRSGADMLLRGCHGGSAPGGVAQLARATRSQSRGAAARLVGLQVDYAGTVIDLATYVLGTYAEDFEEGLFIWLRKGINRGYHPNDFFRQLLPAELQTVQKLCNDFTWAKENKPTAHATFGYQNPSHKSAVGLNLLEAGAHTLMIPPGGHQEKHGSLLQTETLQHIRQTVATQILCSHRITRMSSSGMT